MRYRSSGSILPWRVVPPASHKVSRVSRYSGYQPDCLPFAYGGFTLCAWLSQVIWLNHFWIISVLNPGCPKTTGLGSSLFARRYLGNLNWLLFLRVLRCFSSPGLSSFRIPEHNFWWVPPFGYTWIKAYLRLPVSFRSLSRPSSTPDAKASAIYP